MRMIRRLLAALVPKRRVAAAFVILGLAIAGCGGSGRVSATESVPVTKPPARGASPHDVRVRVVEYAATIVNAGTPTAFVLFGTATRDVRVTPTSSATITERQARPARFASERDRLHWQELGRPRLPLAGSRPKITILGPGQFSFLPAAGPPFTYRDVLALGRTARAIRRSIEAHLGGYGPEIPASVLMRQYGFLSGWGPVPPGSRRALNDAMRMLPGVRSCGWGDDILHRRGKVMCEADADEEVDVVINPTDGYVTGVNVKLRRRLGAYPGLKPGRLIEADAFLPG